MSVEEYLKNKFGTVTTLKNGNYKVVTSDGTEIYVPRNFNTSTKLCGIVADSEESKGLEYFHREYYTASQWGEALQYYKEQSEYDTGVSVSQYDKILILQTCSMDNQYFEKYYRYNLLVMGKLVG